jgi:2-dehydro-3-deoxyphosphogluconate aldolase/(4S)-4-hydroxy-2-oxoglutarate aldolase
MTLDHDKTLQRLLHCGVVAVVRAQDPEPLLRAAEALLAGGVDALEITFTVPNAPQTIARLRDFLGDRVLLGAGTVLDPETARTALLAGAQFLVAPTLSLPTIHLAKRYAAVVAPGAYSPTEVLTAWEAGADLVKIFPADSVGPAFLKALKGPLPQIRLMPTGGIDLENAAKFLNAGADLLGAGSSLVDPNLLQNKHFDEITRRAAGFRKVVDDSRTPPKNPQPT